MHDNLILSLYSIRLDKDPEKNEAMLKSTIDCPFLLTDLPNFNDSIRFDCNIVINNFLPNSITFASTTNYINNAECLRNNCLVFRFSIQYSLLLHVILF